MTIVEAIQKYMRATYGIKPRGRDIAEVIAHSIPSGLLPSDIRLEKVDDYLYNAVYYDIDYKDGEKYFENFKPRPLHRTSACSAVKKGNIVGRYYDWYYDTRCSCVVHTAATKGRHRVVGVAAMPAALTNAFIATGKISDAYKYIPFLLLDGVNDAGLFCEINVVPSGDKGITTGTHPEKKDLFAAMIPRYVLDHASTVDEAIALLENRNVYAAHTDETSEEFHFLLADSTKTVVIEFVNNVLTVIDEFVDDKEIVTNFYLDGYDGTRVSLTPYAMGIERYGILSDAYEDISTAADMWTAMKSVIYTNAYDSESESPWYSEFSGKHERFGDLTKDSPPEAYAAILAWAYDQYEHRERNGITWQTVHSVVYDIAKKEFTVAVQENTDRPYKFSLYSDGIIA